MKKILSENIKMNNGHEHLLRVLTSINNSGNSRTDSSSVQELIKTHTNTHTHTHTHTKLDVDLSNIANTLPHRSHDESSMHTHTQNNVPIVKSEPVFDLMTHWILQMESHFFIKGGTYKHYINMSLKYI